MVFYEELPPPQPLDLAHSHWVSDTDSQNYAYFNLLYVTAEIMYTPSIPST